MAKDTPFGVYACYHIVVTALLKRGRANLELARLPTVWERPDIAISPRIVNFALFRDCQDCKLADTAARPTAA